MESMESQPQKNSNNNSLEAVELLGLSSSDSLDSPSFSQFQAPKPKRKVRFKKTFRSSLRSKQGRKNVSRTCNCNVMEGAKLLGYLLLLAVVGALLWYVVILSTRIQELQEKFSDFEAGNRNTPEALHMIHTKLKLLDSNVTMLYLEVRKNIVDIDNITSEIKLMKDDAKNIKDSIASAPAIQELPKDVHSLSESVVRFGSQINAFESSINQLKEQQSALQTAAQNRLEDLENIKLSVQEMMNSTDLQSKSFNASVSELKFQSAIQELNQTLQHLHEQFNVYKDLPAKFTVINNDSQIQKAHILGLENFINSNLSLRLEQIELEKEGPLLKETELETIVNRTLAAAILRAIDQDVFHLANYSSINGVDGNSHLQMLNQTHDVLVLLAALLREFEIIPKSNILNEKDASQLVTSLMNKTFNEVLQTRDVKIEFMKHELENISQILHNLEVKVHQSGINGSGKDSTLIQSSSNSVTTPAPGARKWRSLPSYN